MLKKKKNLIFYVCILNIPLYVLKSENKNTITEITFSTQSIPVRIHVSVLVSLLWPKDPYLVIFLFQLLLATF